MADSSIYRVPKLIGNSNYDIWALRIESLLVKEGCYSIMTINPADLTLARYSQDQLDELKQLEGKALSIIRLSLEDGPLLQTKEIKSPFTLWNNLQSLYQSKGFSSDFLLSKELINTTLASCNSNVEEYLQKIKRLINSLKARNLELPPKFIAALVLNNLNSKFDYLVTIITQDLRLDKPVDLDLIFSQILDESRRLQGIKSPSISNPKTDTSKDVEMSLNTKESHKNSKFKSSIRCSFCKRIGHKEDQCYKKDPTKRPPNKKLKKTLNTIEERSLNSIITVNNTKSVTDSNSNIVTWILDSGATSHISYRKDIFSNLEPVDNIYIKWGNTNTLLKATAKGNIDITFTSTKIPIVLKDVLLVPELETNLLSLGQAVERGAEFRFNRNKSLAFKDNELLAIGNYTSKLATFTTYSNKAIELASNTQQEQKLDKTTLLHKRLGHIGTNSLNKLVQNTKGLDIKVDTSKSFKDCITYLESKQTSNISREPITTKVDNFGDLIYIDLGGPIKPTTNRGYRYYITFLDYKTKYLEVELLKTRADLVQPIKEFITRLEVQDNKRLKLIQADNELNTKELIELSKEKGFIFRFTPPFNPEAKGGVERINRTLFDKIRALLFESQLPKRLWAEALLSAVYLYNRTPNSSINYITPYEAKYKAKPNIANIRIWGSLCYRKEPKEFLHKLDTRSKQYYLVGYTSNNLYRLLDIKTNKVILTRDVRILEGIYYKSNIKEDLEIESEAPITRSSKKEESEDSNKLITKTHPKVVINNKKDRETSIQRGTNTSIESKIFEEIYYTSKTEDCPKNYKAVLKDINKDNYLAAMQKEIDQLNKNKTWSLVPRPSDTPVLKGRWVLTKKHQFDNLIYKARWVAKGFLQEKEVNYKETFANTSKPNIIRFLLAIFSALNWEIYSWDIKQAFPNALIDTTIYIEQPDGFIDPNYPNSVCKLNKALYGLKQASRQWQKLLASLLAKLDFTPLQTDTATYISYSKRVIIATHVDDLLIFAKEKQIIDTLFKDLSSVSTLEIKNLGEVREFLGVEIYRDRSSRSLYITQEKYISRLLARFNKENIKPKQSPLPPSIKLESNKGEADPIDIKRYQQEIGALIYITTFTRPDLAYAVNSLARYMSNPSMDHFNSLNYLWGYIKNTKDLALCYNLNKDLESSQSSPLEPGNLGKTINLIGSTDSDWGGDFISRRSTTGYIFLLNNNKNNSAIAWLSKLQKTVALSSAEAEFMAYKEAVKESLYLNFFIKEISSLVPIFNRTNIIKTDSQSAIELTKNPNYHARTKHVDIRYYFVREKVENKEIEFLYQPTTTLLADNLTKAVSTQKIKDFVVETNLQPYLKE